MLIQSRHRALVNIAATDASIDRMIRPPKQRPVSAPNTRGEQTTALLSAGEVPIIPVTQKHIRRPVYTEEEQENQINPEQ